MGLRSSLRVVWLVVAVVRCGCVGVSPFDWILDIEASGGGRSFHLNASEYLIDRQYQLPPGTQLRGGPGGGTVIRAVGEPFESVCGENATHRKGLVLGDDTYVGQIHFVGMDTKRLDCLTAMVETPGCANSESHFAAPPNSDECGGFVGRGGGGGVRGATVEDVSVEAFTAQNLLFVAPTLAGAPVTSDLIARRLRSNGTWADGVNVHGAHDRVLVEDCEVRYANDDAFAAWSVGAAQTNMTFRNNRAVRPRQAGGPACARDPLPAGCLPSGCFANYGGQAVTFLDNVGVECYQDAVVILGNIGNGCFGGAWNASSSLTAINNSGAPAECKFLWPVGEGRAGFPGEVTCS